MAGIRITQMNKITRYYALSPGAMTLLEALDNFTALLRQLHGVNR
jgi:hypothetical protein